MHNPSTLFRGRSWSPRAVAVLGGLALLVGAAPSSAADSARTAYMAGRIATDRDTRRNHFARGMALAQSRLDTNPNDAEGLYWLAVNMGAEALERGKLAALPVVPRMEALLLHLDQVSPSYEDAGAARVLGRLYQEAPAVISVGSNKQARRFLNRAMSIAPNHPGNLAFAADFQEEHGDPGLARRYASRCLQVLGGKTLGPEEREWADLAKAVLEKSQ
jgi:hypothetical protein